MKNTIVFLLVLMSCAPAAEIDESQIVGNWRVTAFSADVKNITPEILRTAEANATSSVYIFFEDKTCQMIANYKPKGVNGNWTFSPESKMLKMTYQTEKTTHDNYTIESVNKVQMKWVQELGEFGYIKMTLQRIN